MDDKNITNSSIQQVILKNKLQLWQNTLYDAEVDVRLAKRLEDKQMEQTALERMKQSQKAIDWLSAELKKFTEKMES